MGPNYIRSTSLGPEAALTVYFSMLGLILSSVIKESTVLKVLRSGIGLKLFGGPLGLPGFGMAIRTPELMSSFSWFVNVLFNICCNIIIIITITKIDINIGMCSF